MGLFSKTEKMTFDYASGVMFILSMTLQDQAMIGKSDLELDSKHVIAVNTGYVLGISMIFVSKQIGLKRVNEFIRASMKNAEMTLNSELKPIIPNIQKYCENAKNFVLMEANDIDSNILFEELTKHYMKDLFDNKEYSKETFNLAKNDLLFYYKKTQDFVNYIKIKN